MTDVYDLPRLRQMADAVESRRVGTRRSSQHVQRGAADSADHAVGADRGRGAAVHLRRAAVDRLAAHGELDPAPVPGIRLPPRGAPVADRDRAHPVRHAVRPDGDLGRDRPAAAGRAEAGRLPPGRRGAPAAVAGRAGRSPGRPGGAGRSALGQLLRPRPRREARREHRPALASARSPACSRSPTAPRSNPRSTCRATGSTATRCASAASASAPGATIGTRSTLAPGTRIGRNAEIAPGIRRLRTRARRAALGRLTRRPRRRHIEPARARAPAHAEALALGIRRVFGRARPAPVPRDRGGRHPARVRHPRSELDRGRRPGGAGVARAVDARRRALVRRRPSWCS